MLPGKIQLWKIVPDMVLLRNTVSRLMTKSPALKSRGFFVFHSCLVASNSIVLISFGLPFILPTQHSKLWSAFYPADTAFF